jgi:hypothetical protein
MAIVFTFFAVARAETTAPLGSGQAGWWVHPCETFDRMVTTQKLPNQNDLAQAALCQGLFTGILSVNYIDPPYLPFCEGDQDTPVDYARTFLDFMRAHPSYADKQLGLVVVLALGTAHPKDHCAH